MALYRSYAHSLRSINIFVVSMIELLSPRNISMPQSLLDLQADRGDDEDDAERRSKFWSTGLEQIHAARSFDSGHTSTLLMPNAVYIPVASYCSGGRE